MGGIRSEPGKGEYINMFLLTPVEPGEPTGVGYGEDYVMYPGWGQTGIVPERGEDFAVCSYPIVIKVKDSVEKYKLIRSLRDLANALEAGVNLYIYPHLYLV